MPPSWSKANRSATARPTNRAKPVVDERSMRIFALKRRLSRSIPGSSPSRRAVWTEKKGKGTAVRHRPLRAHQVQRLLVADLSLNRKASKRQPVESCSETPEIYFSFTKKPGIYHNPAPLFPKWRGEAARAGCESVELLTAGPELGRTSSQDLQVRGRGNPRTLTRAFCRRDWRATTPAGSRQPLSERECGRLYCRCVQRPITRPATPWPRFT